MNQHNLLINEHNGYIQHTIQLMDSSIRDGGNVNDWNFGNRTIKGIIRNLVKAKIDYVEIGYLKECEFNDNRTLYQTVSQAERNIVQEDESSEYSLMVQVDKWNWDNLEPCTGKIQNIRVSFHKIRIDDGMALCRRVMEEGYVCHCNPINIMGYSDAELLALLAVINELHPQVFTIVDTFGSISLADIKRISMILQNNLLEDIKIAVHFHENMGLAFALAIEFISQFSYKRDIIIDASLYGIGRVPGNLCIESAARYLNQEYGKTYDIDYIYDAIDDYIASIKKKNPWGYELAYALSGFYNLHRTYAEFLLKKGKLKTKDIRSILESIPIEERVIYNQSVIEKLYKEYICKTYEDSDDIAGFVRRVNQRTVLIIAPGASLLENKDEVSVLAAQKDTIVIAVNFIPDIIRTDILLFTNKKRFAQYSEYLTDSKEIAVTSNLIDDVEGADYIFNYVDLITYGEIQIEDSVLTILHLLNEHAKRTKCYVAGFDSISNSAKYIDESMELVHSVQVRSEEILNAIAGFLDLQIIYIGKNITND